MASLALKTLSEFSSTAIETLAKAAGQQNVGQRERWLSAAAGGGLLVAGLVRGKFSGLLMAIGGGALVYRGLTGHCSVYQALDIDTSTPRPPATSVPAQEGYRFERVLLIQRPPEELYRFWRHLENLPRIMDHLVSVTQTSPTRSHWVASGPMDSTIQWDAEIHNERENELIAWRSLPGSEVDTAGSVHFDRTADGHGTHLRVVLKYNPPAGKAGAKLASLLGADIEAQLDRDLRKFQEVIQSGQPSP